jgi:hypothetical protein
MTGWGGIGTLSAMLALAMGVRDKTAASEHRGASRAEAGAPHTVVVRAAYNGPQSPLPDPRGGKRGRHSPRPACGHSPPATCGGPMKLQALASSSADFVIGGVRPALNDDGRVAFVASDAAGVDHLALADGGPITSFDVSAWGLTNVAEIALDDVSNLAFLAATPASASRFGVFATDSTGTSLQVFYAAQAGGGIQDGGSISASSRLALAPNGTLAFSSIISGAGALYRGPVTGPVSVVLSASGTFYNNQELDLNSSGIIAMQMEHGACGLQRGILLFDTPEPTLDGVTKAIAGLSDGQQPALAINDASEIALALSGVTSPVNILRCAGGQTQTQSVPLGVYIATPTPFDDPPDLTPVADTTGAFVSFGEVDIDNAGSVVFEANLAGGGRGIFKGPDPVADKIVATGDTLAGEVVTDVQLGHLNDACQLSLITVSSNGRRVWRVTGVSP